MSPLPSANTPAPNPFGPQYGHPLEEQIDITDINLEAFKACRQLVEDVACGGFSSALTVFGDTGTGKTHLIGRVRLWLEQQAHNLFVFVRMETSPAGIWRHLRRCLTESMLRKNPAGVRQIDLLLGHRKDNLETASRDLSIILENLLNGSHVRDSAAWLRGDGLPEIVLASLSLSAPAPDDDPEVASRHVVLEICKLIRPGVVVFCMDQIEAIVSSVGDKDGPHAVGQTVSCLVDETRNAAIICCEQSNFMIEMEQILDGAAKSRLFGRRAPIHPLSWDQSERLIKARLQNLPDATASAFWSWAKDPLRTVFTDNAAPARKIIARCKDLFDEWQSGKTSVIPPIDEALPGMLDERFEPKSSADTAAVLQNGFPLLARATGLNCEAPKKRSPFDFTINKGVVTVAICNEASSISLANHVKKISEAWKPHPNNSLLLLRDARLPISANAKATHQRLAALQEQGGRLITISQEAVEALAALRRLLSDAESGDLAHHGESVSPKTVEQWIAGHLPSALDQLVSEFTHTAPPPDDLTPKLAALLAESKMVKLEEAARALNVTHEEVEACARRDPRQFGLLGGSLPALFQPVTAAPTR